MDLEFEACSTREVKMMLRADGEDVLEVEAYSLYLLSALMSRF